MNVLPYYFHAALEKAGFMRIFNYYITKVQPFDLRTITQFFKLVTLFTHSFDIAECGLWIADLKNFLKNIKIRNIESSALRNLGAIEREEAF